MSIRKISWGVKGASAGGWQPYHLHVSVVWKYGSLNLPEPSGPVSPVQGDCFTLYKIFRNQQLPRWRRSTKRLQTRIRNLDGGRSLAISCCSATQTDKHGQLIILILKNKIKYNNIKGSVGTYIYQNKVVLISNFRRVLNPLNPEWNPICYLLALLGAHHLLHVSRIRVKLLTLRRLMSYTYGAPILDVSRSHTTTLHSR